MSFFPLKHLHVSILHTALKIIFPKNTHKVKWKILYDLVSSPLILGVQIRITVAFVSFSGQNGRKYPPAGSSANLGSVQWVYAAALPLLLTTKKT